MRESSYQLATRTNRLRAYFWDMLYVGWPALLGLGLGVPAALLAKNPNHEASAFMVPYLIGIVASCALGLMNLVRFCQTGQTYGKRKLGLVVVSQNGSPLSGLSLFWRMISPGVISMVPLVGIVASFDCLFIFGESRRCLHDYLASSIVVDSNSLGKESDGVGLNPSQEDIGFRRF